MLSALMASLALAASPAAAAEGQPEVLLGVTTDLAAGQVVFQVASSGCTAKADFSALLQGQTLVLLRTRRDTCKATPRRESIAFALTELGLSPHRPFTLGNRLVVGEASAAP